jgi:hypothetical protein
MAAVNVAESDARSITGLLGGLLPAEIDCDLADLVDVERALMRIANGTYGACVVCGVAIDPMTLEFKPRAANCLRCQESEERPQQRAKRFADFDRGAPRYRGLPRTQ